MIDEPAHPVPRRTAVQALLGAALGLGAAPALAADAAPAGAPVPAPFPLDFHGHGPIPWFRRVFHLYTSEDGRSVIESLPTNAPALGEVGLFLRRSADRVTVAGNAPHAGFDFHVANQPTLLIPIFGSMLIGLEDGSFHELVHGDIAFAEDCTGKGHISRAGAHGSFVASIQLPKALCPARGSSDRARLWQQ